MRFFRRIYAAYTHKNDPPIYPENIACSICSFASRARRHMNNWEHWQMMDNTVEDIPAGLSHLIADKGFGWVAYMAEEERVV